MPVRCPNAFTVDVEDYYQVGVFQRHIRPDEWSDFEPRVERNVGRILDLCAEAKIKGTFFTLGWIAERQPEVVRRIVEAGHEIASHGYSHRPIWTMTEAEFRDDIVRAQKTIADACGVVPVTYRAPCFSVVKRTLWALRVLYECGIRFDSSIFPVAHPEYGIPEAERAVHRVKIDEHASIWEFPMTTSRVLGKNLAVCGGGYFRLLPYAVTKKALKEAQSTGRPFVFYLHPWEIDAEQPRLYERATLVGRFRHYVNLGRTETRLRRLLHDFDFATIGDVFRWYENRPEVRDVTYRFDG